MCNGASLYHTWENFGAGKFWRIWQMVSNLPKFSPPMFINARVFNKLPTNLPNFSSPKTLEPLVRQNFSPPKFSHVRYPLLVSFHLQIAYRKVRNFQIVVNKLVGKVWINLLHHAKFIMSRKVYYIILQMLYRVSMLLLTSRCKKWIVTCIMQTSRCKSAPAQCKRLYYLAPPRSLLENN